jgi:hypothetical protein
MFFALPRDRRRKMKTRRMTLRVKRRLRSWSAPLPRRFRNNDVWLLGEACDWLAFPTQRVAEKLAGGDWSGATGLATASPKGGRGGDHQPRHERNHRNPPPLTDPPQRGGRTSRATFGAHPRSWVWSGGCARASLHHRLISLIPPGWADSQSGANEVGNAQRQPRTPRTQAPRSISRVFVSFV